MMQSLTGVATCDFSHHLARCSHGLVMPRTLQSALPTEIRKVNPVEQVHRRPEGLEEHRFATLNRSSENTPKGPLTEGRASGVIFDV
jgi:hypothetical protein